ncbi:MAG: PDZ domain-containing protein [Chitinivibrionales bacterium]|nr:PDZ domain-containing protein [Chitinivibrionales bacterium]
MKGTACRFSCQAMVVALLVGACLSLRCDEDPVSPGYNWQAVQDAWWILDVYFIFRDQLPAGPEDFSDPVTLFESVDEPWTNYYSHELATRYVAYMSTERGGIGILLDSVASGVLIEQVFAGSPGEQAGLLAGDTIVAVSGQNTAGVPMETVTEWLGGEVGETKILVVRRDDGDHTITVTLGTYLAPSVFTDSLDSTIAYIALSVFSQTTIDSAGSWGEFRDALEQTAWADYTILDLRDNGGGSVSQCLDITGEFVPVNTPVIRSREREYVSSGDSGRTIDTTWYTSQAGVAGQRKVYVLVDDYTASASELLLSCLREQRSDIVSVGITTYGKARSQYVFGYDWEEQVYYLADRGLATVTFSLLSPVSGVGYDLTGITPDHVTATSEEALDRAIALIRVEQGGGITKSLAVRRKLDYLERARMAIGPEIRRPLAVYDLH